MSSLRIPKFSRHKASGRGVARFNGKDFYFGPYEDPASRAQYDTLLAEWLANHRRLTPLPETSQSSESSLTVGDLILSFWDHAQKHYRHPDGRPTSEQNDYRFTLKPLRHLYSSLRVVEFTPKKLKAVRQVMIQEDISRKVINQRIGRIKRMFKWGVSEELVPETTFSALLSVTGLQRGRCPEVRESKPVLPLELDQVQAVFPHVLPVVKAMIEVQLLTCMRPGEVCQMRSVDLTPDVEGKWHYRPGHHKTAWRGKERIISVGPQALAILKPYLDSHQPEDYLFSPREAMEQLRMEQRAKRVTSVQPSQRNRRRAQPRRTPNNCYRTASYDRAINRACVAAGIPFWGANRLRHTRGTEVRRVYGLEAAQALLGHSSADVTQIYAERNLSLADKVASEIG